MDEWEWVDSETIHRVHDTVLAEYGGLNGVRDANVIESALARPVNYTCYGNPDTATLAAAHAYGIAKNHGFVDGNKRTAWAVANLFLGKNAQCLQVESQEEIVDVMEKTARDEITETELATWFRERIQETRKSPEEQTRQEANEDTRER